MRRVPFFILWAMLISTAPATAEDWPQWRGPNRDGKSADTGLLKRWPTDGPEIVWQVNNVGVGYGAPAVADGKVFVVGNGPHREWLICLDEKTGEQVWACVTDSIRHNGGGYPGPRCTPSVVDGKIYVIGLAGRVVCCDAKTGAPIWLRDMAIEFGAQVPASGFSESPLVDGDRVICTPGMKKTVVALDANSGKEIWAAGVGDPTSYSSVIKADFDGVPQYVAFTLKGVIGIRAADGAYLWRYDAPSNGQANCPTPLAVGSTIFAASGYGKGGGCATIAKDASGRFGPQEVYFTNKMQNQLGGFVVDDGYLYGCGDPGMLVCLNYKTGKVVKAVPTGRFSIAWADGMLYLRTEDGRVDLYAASPTQLTRRGTFEQTRRSEFMAWAHPVVANGRLYLRDQYVLQCYHVSEKKLEKPAENDPPAEDSAEPPAEDASESAGDSSP